MRTSVDDDAAQPDRQALLQHDDALGVLQARRAPPRAGTGGTQLMPSTPIATPSLRISSTTSLMVPITEPSATTMVSASSVR